MTTSLGEREPSEPLPRIRELTSHVRDIERELAVEVRRARVRGMSWQAIADALGVSRQAAHKRFGRQ